MTKNNESGDKENDGSGVDIQQTFNECHVRRWFEWSSSHEDLYNQQEAAAAVGS